LVIPVALALALAACGGSDDRQASERAGGGAAEARLLSELDHEAGPNSPLKLCDGTPVRVVQVPGDEAAEAWRLLRDEAPNSGLWPVLTGSPEDTSLLADTVRFNCKDGFNFKRVLERASEVDVDRELSKVADAYGVRAQHLRGSGPLPEYPYPKDQFLVPLDVLTQEPLPEVGIALLPIEESWQAPAILPWGNYNDNPRPEVHVAILRDWSRRYDAVLASMTGEVLEMSVGRPPASEEEALDLAREQFMYSPDIVQQGVGDVETLAAAVKNAHAWYFWWD
jgi:hypothetical protein